MGKKKLKPLESTTADAVMSQMKIVDAKSIPENEKPKTKVRTKMTAATPKPEPKNTVKTPKHDSTVKTPAATPEPPSLSAENKSGNTTTKKRIGLNIVISPEQNEALDILAKYNNISKTQLCRNIVDNAIKRNKEKIERYKEFFEIIS